MGIICIRFKAAGLLASFERRPEATARDHDDDPPTNRRGCLTVLRSNTRPAAKPGVLMLVENLPVPFDRRVWMEATTLRDHGYRVTVISPAGNLAAGHFVIDDIDVYRYRLPSKGGLVGHVLEYAIAIPASMALAFWVKLRSGFSVIHAANPPDLFFLIAVAFRPFGVRFIFDHHDLVPELVEAQYVGWKQRIVSVVCRLAEKASFRCADAVISTNESYRMLACTRGGKATNAVFVVRSAPRVNAFKRLAERPELRNGRRYLAIYVGVMGVQDGVDYLLRAIRIVTGDLAFRDVQFVLIGDGDERTRLERLTIELGLMHVAKFTGRIPDSDLKDYLSTADIGLAPDPLGKLNDLSSMNKIVEYMAMGLPVVSFDLKESRRTAHGAAAFAPPNSELAFASEIVTLLCDLRRRTEMAKVGRDRFERELCWERQEGRLLSAYDSVLSLTGPALPRDPTTPSRVQS